MMDPREAARKKVERDAWEAWEMAWNDARDKDRALGRRYDKKKYAEIAAKARGRVLLWLPSESESESEPEARDAGTDTLLTALEQISELAGEEHPEYDDWGGDTERAENYGHAEGVFEAAVIARAAMAAYRGEG